MKKIAYYILFIFLFILTSFTTTTFSKYTQDINKKLTLNVAQPNYTITFDKNNANATGSTESVSCVYGTSCNLSINGFTNDGYIFDSWNTKADGTGTTLTTSALNLTAINDNEVTLYAVWTPINYTISYDLRDGYVSSNPTTYNTDTATFTLSNPTRSGYIFEGWTGSNGTTPNTIVSIPKGSIGDKSYTANWYKNAASLTITLSENTYTYDGATKTPTVTVKDGNVTLTEGIDYEISYSNNKNAGTASVTVSMKNTYNSITKAKYKNSKTLDYTINKKTVTVKADNKTMTYGSSVPNYTSTVNGVIPGETAYTGVLTYNFKNSSGQSVSISSASPSGSYTINPSGLIATNNYLISYIAGTLTIEKATPTVNLSSRADMIYNGLAKEANAASVTLRNNETYNSTINYTYYSDSSCTSPVTTSSSGASSNGGMPVYAGTYYVKASISAFGNYNAATSSCVLHRIAKKSVTITADNKTRSYGDTTSQTYSYTVSGAIGSETVATGTAIYTVKNNGGTIVNVDSSLPYGTYTITPSALTETKNYSVTYINGTLTVNKANPVVSLSSKLNMVYNKLAQNSNDAIVTLKNNEEYKGIISYVYYSDSNCLTPVSTSSSGASSIGTTPVNAGNWYVKASISAFGNYNAATSSCVSHTISKATPVITITNTETSGYTPGSSKTFQEKADVDGIFHNTSSNTGVVTVSPQNSTTTISTNTDTDVTVTGVAGGSSTITVTFTPTDTVNYNTITSSSANKKSFNVTASNKVTININKDGVPKRESTRFVISLSDYIIEDLNNITSTYVAYDVPAGSYPISASIGGSVADTGVIVNVTSSNGVLNNATATINFNTVSINKGTCASVTGSGTYLDNQIVNISATPSNGQTFNGWTVETGNSPADLNSASTTVSASRTTTLTANCLGNAYKLTLLYNHTQDQDFEYTGEPQLYTIPASMIYKFEAWGAQGGAAVTDAKISTTLTGGEGAYTSGYIYLDEGTNVYTYVGQRPSSVSSGKSDNVGGYNGGGTGRWDRKDNDSSGGGGGATDFRIFDNSVIPDATTLTWNNATGLRYRVMVAAGGAGSSWVTAGRPYAGALSSPPSYNNNNVATQTSGNAFGVGGTGTNAETSAGISGGGGGYWGGHAGAVPKSTSTASVGTGGSSYISGYTGAVAIASNTVNTPRYASDGITLCANGTTDQLCSVHFTGYEFTDDPYISNSNPDSFEGKMLMKAGSEVMPSHDGDDEITTTTGNSGNGYARISISSYQKDVYFGNEVGEIPSPMLANDEFLDEFGNYLLDEDGEPVILGAQEIDWRDENNNPVYEHTLYNVAGDTTWHAEGFRPKTYRISYNLDGGVADNPTYYDSETDTFILQRPTRPGYRFDGWTGSNGSTLQKDITIENGSFGNKEYTAHWTQGSTLYIETNGGTYSGENPRIEPALTNGVSTVIDIPVPVKAGHYLSGWILQGSTSNDDYGFISNNTPIKSATQQYTYGTNDAVLTAVWEERDDITISFDSNGGTSCSNIVGSYGRSWHQSCIPEKAGYEFDGWYDKADGGNQVNNTGTFNDDLELYAHWIGGVAKIEMDYNINQTFGSQTMLDTYYSPDWSKSFDIDVSFTIGSSGKRYLIIGNYDNSAANSLNVEVTQNNQIRIYVGKGTINDAFGTVSIGEENILHLHWDGSTKVMTGELSGAGSGSYGKTLNNLTGLATRNLRIGALDYREGSSNIFTAINVTNLVIGEYYESPLQAEFIVPDPAGHYLLFDGWTGANGTEPQYNVIVPLNSYGTVRYVANWSPGFSLKSYKSGNYSTSNQYIKFYYNITAVYADQARRKAYTYERVYFYRTNTGYTTYGTGSMTIKYNGTAYTKSITSSNEITNSGITLWSRYWNSRSNTFDTISYSNSGTKSVTIGISKFSHQKFSISGLPKNYTIALPEIKPISN